MSNDRGFVATEKTDDGTTTVIVTPDGASSHRCPGGITEDDLVD